MSGRAYRADIDGLRAVAVLAVIGFHFFPQWFPAGFVGVDIFFVISGYLISGIIVERAQSGRFSLPDFYARRIRRIFPALVVVMLTVGAIGWPLLYSEEYALLGTHMAAGAGFLSNVVLWMQTGYFAPSAETMPLLHLWSLGVEEQFYLVWPLVLAVICRSPRSRFWAVLGILVLSLVACIEYTPGHAVPAFYLPMFRFWEFMAGAAFAVHPQWEARSPLESGLRSWAGLALVVASFFVHHPDSSFPGWRATLPVAGAALLVSAGPAAFPNRTFLSTRPLVFLGLISYPLYLWHWPLLSLLRISNNDAPVTPARAASLFAASLVLAWLTYVLVERPVRTGRLLGLKAAACAVAMACVGGLGWSLSSANGVPSREVNSHDPTWPARNGRGAADAQALLIDDCRLPVEEAKLFGRCARESRGPERFALVGDSKADALFHGLVRTSRPQGRWLFIGGSTAHDSVLPVLSDAYGYQYAKRSSELALRAVEENPRIETVVLFAATRSLFHLRGADSINDLPDSIFYAVAREAVGNYVRHLVAAGKKVVIVVDHPTLPDTKRCLRDARVQWHGRIADFLAIGQPDPRCQMSLDRHEQLAAPYRKLLEEVRAISPQRVTLFETAPHLCDMGRRLCSSFDGDVPLYSFADHISDQASTRIGEALNARLMGGKAAPPSP